MRSPLVPLLAASLLTACGPQSMPEAPAPSQAPASASAERRASNDVRVCVIRNGALEMIPVRIDPARGDTTTADGRRLSGVSPASGYAAGADWYQRNEAIIVRGYRFVKYGIPRQRSVTDVGRIGEYRGVPVFAEAGATGTPEILYIPDRPGCSFQMYTGPHAME